MSLMLKSLLGSKSIWIVILVLSTIGYAYYKYDNLLDIIEDKDKVIISKDAQEIFPDYCFRCTSKAHAREAITRKSIIPENLKSIINANRVLLNII